MVKHVVVALIVDVQASSKGAYGANYVEYPSTTSYDGHGGTEIDSDSSAPSGLSVVSCEDRCDADSACQCVSFRPSDGKCWKRGNCVPSQFGADDNYDTYVKTATPSPTPSGTCSNTAGQDCNGRDLQNVVGYSPTDCCNACSQIAGCGAYVYVAGGSYGNTCYLKSSCDATGGCVDGGRCTAGLVEAPAPSPPVPVPVPSPLPPTPMPAPSPTPGSMCSNTIGQDCQGQDITSVTGYSTDDCCKSCSQTAGCGAYVFVQGGSYGNTCYLKTSCVAVGGCAADGQCTAGVHTGPPTPAPPIPPTPAPSPVPAGLSIRVAKALGGRGYDKLRVSLIRQYGQALPQAAEGDVAWSYSSQFVHKWTGMHLSSALVDVEPGIKQSLSLDGFKIDVRIPKQDEGSVGLLIADPCIDESQWCPYANTWDVEHTLQSTLNTLAAHDELDYWMNIGDLFYDQVGDTTARFFSGLSVDVQSRIHGVSMGNHDFWQDGKPGSAQWSDNFGNGLMQWYAQDAMSGKSDASQPFDFSIDPSTYQVAHFSNFFWYNMIGNVAFIGFSGEAGWDQSEAYFEEACSWAQQQNPALLVLLGHWDADNLGCASGMASPEVYGKVSALPACATLGSRIKYFEGHNHCNRIVEDNTGFMVGANGMAGCGDFGLPILDTRGGQATLWYFSLGSGGNRHTNWDEVLGCIKSYGFAGCTQYADIWMQEQINAANYTAIV